MYASFGDGHRQVAHALQDVLKHEYRADVALVDPFRQTNRALAAFNEWVYETLTAYAPFLYGWSYNWTRRLSPQHVLWKVLAVFSRRATWEKVCAHQPDIVVQLFPDHALAKYPPTLRRRPLIVTALTDYALHSRWFHRNVDLYLMPTDDIVAKAARFRARGSKVAVSGIPIRDQFSVCRLDTDVSQGPIVISAGGRGVFPNLSFVLTALLRQFGDRNIVVLCGRNDRMLEKVQEIAQTDGSGRLLAVSFTDDVASYVQRASFVVAKAGGISISECLSAGTPMLFYKPQPGQEHHNAMAIARLGAGHIATGRKDFLAVLKHFEGQSLADMSKSAIAIAHPDAAVRAARAIVQAWGGRCGMRESSVRG
ncbi:MGDG synthase family glycosyltransferase [Alicyclobacillus fastidiosus]|uniref:Glycosyltransferase n=1 Tax=Alicyclobacillus fastidiosus TaxID=392011 RepID=A0ABV5AHV2_9BACL|nr:glycosyltransferase [Alicyclobacillus fastidiosus]WEH11546.1 glycosyltransferase [Alicyclobacillus fastidiosus]